MSQIHLWSALMSAAALIDRARGMAAALISAESRGPGDTINAMRRIARRDGIPYAALWALRYKPPKDIYASIWVKLTAAHEAMCERQLQKYTHERIKFGADTTGLSAALVSAADALAGKSDG